MMEGKSTLEEPAPNFSSFQRLQAGDAFQYRKAGGESCMAFFLILYIDLMYMNSCKERGNTVMYSAVGHVTKAYNPLLPIKRVFHWPSFEPSSVCPISESLLQNHMRCSSSPS